MSKQQVTSFRPGNGTTYRNETSPRIPVEFLPDEMDAIRQVMHTGYCPYQLRGAFLSARARMDQAHGAEQTFNEGRAG